jgi:hypothetical protein
MIGENGFWIFFSVLIFIIIFTDRKVISKMSINFHFFKKKIQKRKNNDVIEKLGEFSKSLNTSSFSETQKKSTEKFLSDITKNIKEEDVQPETKTNNKVEVFSKMGQSNSEERLEIITDGKVYRVTGPENIRKTKEQNDPKKNNISSLFNLNEYYESGVIKKKTEKNILQNLYTETFYNKNGTVSKKKNYYIEENSLMNEVIYNDSDNYQINTPYDGGEVRKSFYVDSLKHGVEKVFDKEGVILEELTFEYGRETYYKEYVDGKITQEYVVNEELDLSEYEGADYYAVNEDFRVLYKEGKEVASGFIMVSCNRYTWDFDAEANDEDVVEHYWDESIKEEVIINGEIFTDYDEHKGVYDCKKYKKEAVNNPKKYEDVKIATFFYEDDAIKFFDKYIKRKCQEIKQ